MKKCPVCKKKVKGLSFLCVGCSVNKESWVHPRCGNYLSHDISTSSQHQLKCNNCKVLSRLVPTSDNSLYPHLFRRSIVQKWQGCGPDEDMGVGLFQHYEWPQYSRIWVTHSTGFAVQNVDLEATYLLNGYPKALWVMPSCWMFYVEYLTSITDVNRST